MNQDYVMCEDEWLAWMADKPILRRLYDERVFSLGFLEDGNLGVQENCDCYFFDDLTLGDLAALIKELEAVHAEMSEIQSDSTRRSQTQKCSKLAAEKQCNFVCARLGVSRDELWKHREPSNA